MSPKNLSISAIFILLCLLLPACEADRDGMFFRYDTLDPLYHQLSEKNNTEIVFKLDRELMQKASEYRGFMQLSAYQAYCISTMGNQALTPVMEKSCAPVIMLDKTKDAAHIKSFQDLLDGNYDVAIYNSDSDMVKWLVYVVNKTMGGSASDLSAGYSYFSQLQKENRLYKINYRQDHDPVSFWLAEGVEVVICWDYQAEYVNELAQNRFQVICPRENIPTKQYLVYRGAPVKPLPPDIASLLKEQGFEATTAFAFGESEELTTAYANYKPEWRRTVLGTHINTTASVNEKFALNAFVLLLLICINTSIFLKAKNRKRIFIAYLIISGSLLMWQFLWLIKTLLWEDHDPLYTFLWHTEFPLIMAAAIAWRILCYELRWDRAFPRKWLFAMIGINLILSLLAFTNGLHQQVFHISYPTSEVYWYNDYTYGWGYWLIYAITVWFLFIGAYDYFRYAVTRERRRQLLFLLLAITGALAINFMVVFEDVFEIHLDVAWQTSFLTAFFINLAIRNRFLDQGLDFAAVLDKMHIPVAIRTHGGKWLYQSKKMIDFDKLPEHKEADHVWEQDVIEDTGRFYRPEYQGFMGKTVVLLHDISDQIKQGEAVKKEKEIMEKTSEFLKERARTMEIALSSHNQLIWNERLSEVFHHLLKDLTGTLRKLQVEGIKLHGDSGRLAQAQASRSGRLLRIMLWGLQDENVSGRQMAELLAGECSDACMRSLDMVLAMKPEGLFPLRFAYGVFGCVAALIDTCLDEDYTRKLLVRVISDQDAVVLLIFLSDTELNFNKLEEFARSVAAAYTREKEDDALTLRIEFGKEADSL